MPFLLAEILNFQGSTHHIGVGSFSKKNNKNKEKEGQARERCYGSCFWFVLFCDFLKTVKNIEK